MSQFIICLSGNHWYSLNMNTEAFTEKVTLNKNNNYITFQVSDFIRFIKSENKNYIPGIINLESFDRQFSQTGKDLLKGGKWSILKALRREEIIDSQYKIDKIEPFLKLIKNYYERLLDAKIDESRRFRELEVKVNKLIHKTALNGITIDERLIKERCVELHNYLYQLKNKFQFEYNIFQPENTEAQFEYLKSKKYRILKSVRRTVKLLRKSDEICKNFYEINRTSQDLKSLIYISARYGGKNLVHPYYDGFGTITSRIVIKEPALQNLKKTNRKIIIPEKGKSFFYIDYCQYEAGILANFSEDSKLIDLYNKKDIYNDIVEKIYKEEISTENRKLAKILFFRYLYGDDFSNDLILREKVNDYFDNFQSLSKFKNELIQKCNNESTVESINGNHRILDKSNDNIWILSHYIQSIASYIFKKSLLEVFEKEKNVMLLIPLHDGALYQTDDDKVEISKKAVKEIFLENLKKTCPHLTNPKITFEEFYN